VLATAVLLLTQFPIVVGEVGWRRVPVTEGAWQIAPAAAGAPAAAAVTLATLPVQPGERYRVAFAYRPDARQPGAPQPGAAAVPRLAVLELDRAGLPAAGTGDAAPAAQGRWRAPGPAGCVQWSAELTTGPDAAAVLLVLEPARPVCHVTLRQQALARGLRAWEQASSPLALGAVAAHLVGLAVLAGSARRHRHLVGAAVPGG
jgi:hypothetical protein